jgi:two-component system, NarL family, sensor histidine kinase DesK
MKWPKIPSDENKPSWGGLVWSVPMAYVFVDPYQRQADWTVWALVGVGYATFMALYAMGLIYWSRKDVLLKVCVATTVLATIFTLYQSSFALFFVLVAAFSPFTVAGNIPWSIGAISAAISILFAVSWLKGGGPHMVSATIFGIESLIIGAGTTFVARQQSAMARAHKVAERERIARDLHDILGHSLSVIILKSELAGKLAEHDPQRAQAEIADVEKISRQALAEVREAIRGYHAGGIQSEFERAHATLHAAGIKVEHECETIDISATHESVLVLALREAVTNIVRHSQAKHCWIDLRRVDDACRLQIRDDGRGGYLEEGFGIRGMRHRVESNGGSMSLKSEQGTELTIMLPALAS